MARTAKSAKKSIYGVHPGVAMVQDWIAGLSAKTGKSLWRSKGRIEGSAAILNAGSVWLVLTTKGKLIVVKPGGSEYEPIAEYEVSDTPTWAHPVFLGNRILIKDQTSLRSFVIDDGMPHGRR